MRPAALLWLSLLALPTGCETPPADAYLHGAGIRGSEQAVDLGRNTVDEACVQSGGVGNATDIYCGAWQQPSAHVRAMGPGDASRLAGLMEGGQWRTALDTRNICGQARPVTLGDMQGLQLSCNGRFGGWPYTAVGLVSGGQVWLADGVVSSVPAITQSVAVLSGRIPAKTVSSAAVVAAQAERAGEQARGTGDSRQYEFLMAQGTRANLVDNSIAAESAYGAALAVQEKALGKDNPNLAEPLMHLALQFSNEGRFVEADQRFSQAERLAPLQRGDNTLTTRLKYYEGLHALNQSKLETALAKLREAEAGYLAAIDPAVLNRRPAQRKGFGADLQDVIATPADQQNRLALLGLVETRRFEAVVLRDLHRPAESMVKLQQADEVAQNARLNQPTVMARLRRSVALTAAAEGRSEDALAEFSSSTNDFRRAYPGSRPLALVGLLNAQELMRVNRSAEAVAACRISIQVLIEVKSGYPPERMASCLAAFALEAAKAKGQARQDILDQMFLAAQLVRNSKTEQQITQSAARLGASTKDSKVGAAIRNEQDAAVALASIRRRQQEVAEAAKAGQPVPAAQLNQLAEQEQAASAKLAEQERALQAAAPNFGQLVQQVTPAADILKLLQPDEAFAAITLTANDGWAFVLRNGQIEVGRINGGAATVDPLVTRIRAAMEPNTPAFDIAAAQALYGDLFGSVATQMAGVTSLTVAPSGSLLALPFAVLLSGPADQSRLAEAPWLTRQMAIGHVPSPSNFVALRQVAGRSQATSPWFGMGDFKPVTLAQARRSFGSNCGDSAQLLAQLPPLPSARQELSVAAKILGASAGDELLGDSFTVPAVQRTDLARYRVLHFATHAILPSDLACQTEPAIITSPVRNAADASSALLTASDLTEIKLDADLVILSACNSGGSDGKLTGGESLSALARSFFYGGARALLITHWEVNDQVATFITADTLRRINADPATSVARALQLAQTDILDRAGKSLPAEFAHPFYWAPFALLGQSGVPVATRSVAARL